jgi:hypothetical protein
MEVPERPTHLGTRRALLRKTRADGSITCKLRRRENRGIRRADGCACGTHDAATTRRHDAEAVRLVAPASRGVRMRDPGNTSQPAADSACVSRISHPHAAGRGRRATSRRPRPTPRAWDRNSAGSAPRRSPGRRRPPARCWPRDAACGSRVPRTPCRSPASS